MATDKIGNLLEKVAQDLFITARVDDDLQAVLERQLGPLLRAGQAMRDSNAHARNLDKAWDAALATLEEK